MARVHVVNQVRQGGRRVAIKRVLSLAPILKRATVEATTTQLRVMAEEARELVLDKLFAAVPQPPAEAVVKRPPVLRRPAIPQASRAPFKHRPLSKEWLNEKAREGLDGRKLIATGDYVDGIEVYRGEQVGAGVYYMVRPAVREHEPSGLMLRRIARIHEFGSATLGIPARPHWSPVARAIIDRFRKLRRTVRADILRRAFRRLT